MKQEIMSPGRKSAFPHGTEQTKGLTKREYFAGLAMQGILARGDCLDIPERAVKMADALLEALEDD